MPRSYYDHQEDLQIWRHSTRGMSYPIPQAMRADGQQELSGGYGGRLNSTAEPEAKSSGAPSRRRIQLACTRCRRRKIKCSGDIGNGQCTNCRNAGSPHCEFLRVNSFRTQAKATYSSAWPYPAAGPLMTPYGSGSGYETQATSRANIHSIPATFPLFPKAQCSYEHSTQFSPVTRGPYMSACPINYDGDSVSYNMSSPAYMLPSTDSSGGSSYCSYPASPRGSQVSKMATEDLYPDQDHHALGSSYYMAHSQPPVSDIPSAGPLLSSIPSSSGPDRTLPNPATSRNGRESGSTMPITSAETSISGSYGVSQILNARTASHHLSLDGLSSSSPHSSVRTTSTSMANGTSSPSTTSFGYVITTNSPSTTLPSTSFPPTESIEAFHTSSHNRCSELRQQASSYSHSTEMSGHCGTSSSSGNLSNGKAYTRLPAYGTAAAKCAESSANPTSSLLAHKTDGY
ncbi:hypothetical protein AJ79_08953 [Helicocarpus griseus UAMH5409]|uniref:Zn(2)-C6 fungal-type domain-containing protein n=1 Tax=Helicocarpus griseus UAMH5409 TaxID=1447875 RepID=A0A2B7WFK9_9EURO|nr:hypothetical protein AJ79_08953 [Helicocarpus griseus UAMH5409]